MLRIFRILEEKKFDGVLVPGHTPKVTCGAPWYAGMA